MRPTITSNTHNGRHVNVLNGAGIVVKKLAEIGVIGSEYLCPVL
jgi:hypothetical protein